MKRQIAALLCALALLGCAGCSTTQQEINRYNATLYVQGFLSETYLGTAPDAYLSLMDADAESVEETFQKNLEAEYTQRLAVRFELNDAYVPKDLRADFLALLEQVYAKTRFTVKTAVPLDDERFCVEVSVTPVTFFHAAYTDGFAKLKKDFQQDHPQPTPEALAGMTDAQARRATERYEQAWAAAVYDYLYARLDAITTGSAVTKLCLVSPNPQGYYFLSQTDLQDIDDTVLAY